MTEKSPERFAVSFDENGDVIRTPVNPQPEQEFDSRNDETELPYKNNEDLPDEREAIDTEKPRRGLFRRRSLGRVAAREDVESPAGKVTANPANKTNVLANYLSGKNDDSEDIQVGTTRHELGMKEKVFMEVGKVTLMAAGIGVGLGGGVYATTSMHLERAPGPIEFTGGVIDNLNNLFNDDVKYKVGESNE